MTATIVVAAVVVITTVTAGTGTAACIALGAAHGALQGVTIGAVTGAVAGAAGGAIKSRIENGTWEGAGQAALNGAVQGAIDGSFSGAISGAITGGLTSNYCFAAGTAVSTALGSVLIENIQVGDYVWATDPETGETELKEVVQLFHNETNEWIHLTVKGEEIVCTPEHPFYSPVKGWTKACQLRAGDILVTLNGEYVVLEKIQHEILESPETTYNFEVEGFHTYYVGRNFVLVHNACKFSPDQQAVLELAEENKNGLSMKDAETLWDWAQEYGISGHGPKSGHGKMWQGWHIKIKNYHMPIFPN